MSQPHHSRFAGWESLEGRTFLSAGPLGAVAARAHGSSSTLHATLSHGIKKGAKATPTSILPASGDFSYTYGGLTLTGHVDRTTHALTGELTGPMGLDLSLDGTYDPTARSVHLHATGAAAGFLGATDVTVDGSLAGRVVSGTVDGTLFGHAVHTSGTFTL